MVFFMEGFYIGGHYREFRVLVHVSAMAWCIDGGLNERKLGEVCDGHADFGTAPMLH